MDYLEDNNLFSKDKSGFRKGFRTTDHILVMRKIIERYINTKNGRIYACFVDFQKAFDSVWRDALLLKLHNIGLQGNVFRLYKTCTRTHLCVQKQQIAFQRK